MTEPARALELLPTGGGGTRFGCHFILNWWNCPMFWFNRQVRPHPTKGGWGCRPTETASPLFIGGVVHIFLENWYRSLHETGKPNLDTALEAAWVQAMQRKSELKDQDVFEKDWALIEKVCRKYDDYYGPGGLAPERIKVAVDNKGEPLIEREFEIDLGYSDYVFTCKVDLVVEQDGFMRPMEHKTSAASMLGSLAARVKMDLQPTGELFVLKSLFPDREIDSAIINVLIKDRSAKRLAQGDPEFTRVPVTKRPEDFIKFRTDIVQTLVNIEESLSIYLERIDAGCGVDESARKVFTQYRHSCTGKFGRNCDYYGPCLAVGREETMFRAGFEPRAKDKQFVEEENLGD